MNSYNEISYRYVKAPLEFYIPSHWRYQDTQNRQGSAAGHLKIASIVEQYIQSLKLPKKLMSICLKKVLLVK